MEKSTTYLPQWYTVNKNEKTKTMTDMTQACTFEKLTGKNLNPSQSIFVFLSQWTRESCVSRTFIKGIRGTLCIFAKYDNMNLEGQVCPA